MVRKTTQKRRRLKVTKDIAVKIGKVKKKIKVGRKRRVSSVTPIFRDVPAQIKRRARTESSKKFQKELKKKLGEKLLKKITKQESIIKTLGNRESRGKEFLSESKTQLALLRNRIERGELNEKILTDRLNSLDITKPKIIVTEEVVVPPVVPPKIEIIPPPPVIEVIEDEPPKVEIEGSFGFGMTGVGLVGGLREDKIDDILKNIPEFVGTYAMDEIKNVDFNKSKKPGKFAFIFNTDPRSEPGTHWIGVYVDTRGDSSENSYSINYFDPLGDPPSVEFLEEMKTLIGRMKLPLYLKMKINRIRQQNAKTKNCGWFASKFVIVMSKGTPFRVFTKYDNSKQGERRIEKFKDFLDDK